VDGHSALASVGGDGTLRRFDATTGAALGDPVTVHAGTVRGIGALDIGGATVLVTGDDGGRVRLWDPGTGEPRGSLDAGKFIIGAVAPFSVNGEPRLAVACADRTIRVWDPDRRDLLPPLTGHTGSVRDVHAFTDTGRPMLASASSDRTVRLWDLTTGTNLLTIPVQHQALCCVYHEGTLMVGLPSGLIGIDIARTALRQ
jgi:WD40 repeat protein